MNIRKVLGGIAAISMITLLLVLPSSFLPHFGRWDFEAYWSSSYLLSHGNNFADPQLMLQTEKSLTQWTEDYPMMTWNPPWLLALLIPLTWVSFDRAAWWWMLSNITLIFASAFFLWQVSRRRESNGRLLWIIIATAFVFSSALVALVVGQVNPLVLFGLGGFLFFSERKQDWIAGALFSLTMIKPHLVYLTAAIVLLRWLTHKSWRALAGFAGVLIGLTLVVVFLRPTFLSDYSSTIGGGGLFDYQTPTLGGWLSALSGWNGYKWMCVVVLPIALLGWWRTRAQWDWQTLFDSSLMLSVITMPFGWSYDFIVLLVPIARMVTRFVEGTLTKIQTWILAGALVVINLATFWMRANVDSELYFFWVPIVVALIYAYTFAVGKRRHAVYE